MAEIIDVNTLRENSLDESRTLSVYCGLDCCVTREIHEVLWDQVQDNPNAHLIYNFERALRGPVMDMQLRGIKVDLNERRRAVREHEEKRVALKNYLNEIIKNLLGWAEDAKGWRLNPSSPQKLKYLFYGVFGLKEVYKFQKGEKTLTTNVEALKKWQKEENFPIDYICKILLSLRDLTKVLGFLKYGVEKDGRMRFAYSITGTITGRFSSSKNIYSRGGNSQNYTNYLRRIFIADDKRKLGYCDLSGAEARVVAYRAKDQSYIDANEGDLKVHTYVAQMIWNDHTWPNDPEKATEYAENTKFAGNSLYKASKIGQHLSNYWGAPSVMAKSLGISVKQAKEFQDTYYDRFPGIHEWHKEVAQMLQTEGVITTSLGRRRKFYKRKDDHTTIREAIAYEPQSTIGDLLNYAMLRVWLSYHPVHYPVRLLSQLHDAILIDYPEDREDELLAKTLEIMTIPFTIGDSTVVIPVDAKSGWNWEEVKESDLERNPDGLIGWKLGSPDKRTRVFSAKIDPMDLIC